MKSEIAAGVEVGMIRGSARVRSADGSERPLAVGDRLGEGDELIVPEGSEVLLLGGGHGQLLIDAGDYRLTEEALAPGGGLDGAVQSGDVERVLEALEEGRDPFEDIEAPAAGAAGTEGGHSFVRLLRIAEEITPVGYEFPANGQGPIRAPEEAGAAEAEPGEEPPEDDAPSVSAGSVSVDETGGLDAAYGALAAAFGEDLPGTVELSAEGAVWDGEAQELRDEGGAWVIRLVEGGYEFEQLLPMAHPDGEDPNDAIEIAVTATATDSDGSQASAQFSVWVYDDGPSLNPPDAALANEAGNRVEGDLGFDPGADGEGAFVRFSAPAGSVDASGYILADWSLGDQGGTARLTMGGEPLRWEEQEDGSLLAVTGEGDAALRVSSDGSVWSVEILGDIDQALIWSTFLTENIQGGNGDFYLVAGEMAGDLLSESIEMRASAVSGGEADTVNTRADYFGVGTGQDISGSQGDELLLEFAQAGSWDPDSGEPTADYEAAEALALSFETSGLGDGESLLWRATLSDGSVAEGRIDGAGNPNSAANKAVWTIGSEDLGGLGLVSIEFSAEGDSSYDIGSFAARAEEGSADQTIRIAAQGFDGDGDATVAAGIEIYLAGDGQIEGTSGADLLSGGSGSDALWGQAGADVFEWTLSDASGAEASEDVVKDFSIAQGDSLKIGDLLPDLGEAWTGEALSAYVSIVEEGGSSSLLIRPSGAAGEVEQVISLEGISLLAGFDTQADALQHMLDQGSLRTD